MGVLSKTTSEIEDALKKADDIETAFDTMFTQKMLSIYPIGAIYMSASSTSPASLFGGTWEQIQDKFLLAAGSSYAAGNTGGEAAHTLTELEIPRHTHALRANTSWGESEALAPWAQYFGSNILYDVGASGGTITRSYYAEVAQPVGSGAAHNNMPPYLAVYVWKRTA